MFELGNYTVLDAKSKSKGEAEQHKRPHSGNVAPSSCKPDLDAAHSYMDLLHEGEATEFRVMWPKSKPLLDGAKTYIQLCGCFGDVADKLIEFNQQGYGIFAVVNRISERKRVRGGFTKDGDISGVKAVWVDLDEPLVEGELTHIGQLLELPLSPSMIVETSPGRFQAYWLVEDGLSNEQGVEINRALARLLGGDLNATNISRVLRVPGFYNTKQVATQVQIRHAGAQIFPIAAILELTGGGTGDKPLVYVQDGKGHSSSALPKKEQDRLANMRATHAKERGSHRRALPVKQQRNVNPSLPALVAQALRDCNTLASYESTLVRVWPRQAGNRQTLALAVSGDLFKFRCSEREAIKIVEVTCRAAGDDEVAERREAVRSTYRKARGGGRITATGAGAPMTAFEAIAWGPDLRHLPSNKRSAEAERRIREALRRLPVDATGIKKCSCRSLAEMTGISKNKVNEVLNDFKNRGVLKRGRNGVVTSVEP